MTVSIAKTKVLYTGDGENTQWDIPFPFLSKDDLKVYLVTEYGSTLLLRTDYTIDETLCTLTYPLQTNGTAPISSSQKLLIMRSTPMVQDTTFQAQEALDPDVLEKGYDKAMMIAQELSEQMQRALKVSVAQTASDKTADEYFQELEEDVVQAQTCASSAIEAKQLAQSAASSAQNALENISTALAGKQNVLTAGNGISLANDVIAATSSWGNITGTLAQQTDLQAALNTKADTNALDGSWVTNDEINLVTVGVPTAIERDTPLSFDISSHFESGKVYELLISCGGETAGTHGASFEISLCTSLIPNKIRLIGTRCAVDNIKGYSVGSATCLYTGGDLILYNGSGSTGSTVFLCAIRAYRRVK